MGIKNKNNKRKRNKQKKGQATVNITFECVFIALIIVLHWSLNFYIKIERNSNIQDGNNKKDDNNNNQDGNNKKDDNNNNQDAIVYKEILMNIINFISNENVTTFFLFLHLLYFIFMNETFKTNIFKTNIILLLFYFITPIIVLVSIILFFTGFFTSISNIDKTKVMFYIYSILLFFSIYSLYYPINNILNRNKISSKDILTILTIIIIVIIISSYNIVSNSNLRKEIRGIFGTKYNYKLKNGLYYTGISTIAFLSYIYIKSINYNSRLLLNIYSFLIIICTIVSLVFYYFI